MFLSLEHICEALKPDHGWVKLYNGRNFVFQQGGKPNGVQCDKVITGLRDVSNMSRRAEAEEYRQAVGGAGGAAG